MSCQSSDTALAHQLAELSLTQVPKRKRIHQRPRCGCGSVANWCHASDAVRPRPVACIKCREPGMVYAAATRCNCGLKVASFGFPDGKMEACGACVEPGMVNRRKGEHKGIMVRKTDTPIKGQRERAITKPSDESKAKRKRRLPSKPSADKCACGWSAHWGYIGQDRSTHCIRCRKKGMYKLDTLCKCGTKSASFGYPHDGLRVCCKACKSDGMVILNNPCICGKSAYFGYPVEGKKVRCNGCKEPGMVNLANNRCKCGKGIWSYGFMGSKPECCSQCKEPGMVYMYGRCYCGKNIASFGYASDGKKVCCLSCKDSGMVNLSKPPCSTPMCGTMARTKGLCNRCYFFTHPDSPRTKCIRTKEKAVADHVRERFPGLTWQLDRRVPDGCSLRRPDMLVDLGSHCVIVEVDEHRHEDYDPVCENRRLMEIFRDLGCNRPLVVIRFNPDGYEDPVSGKRVGSCWSHVRGMTRLKRSCEAEWADRLESLVACIGRYVCTGGDPVTVPVRELTVERLFFGDPVVTD